MRSRHFYSIFGLATVLAGQLTGAAAAVAGIVWQGGASHQIVVDSSAGTSPAVALLPTATWSPNDAARDGAAEFAVWLTAARLVQANPLAGMIAPANPHGVLHPATEAALRRVAFMGVPVVRWTLAKKSGRPPAGDDLLIAASGLSAPEAEAFLATCLARFGALPPASDPHHPTEAELAALRSQLALYQAAFDAKIATEVVGNLELAAR